MEYSTLFPVLLGEEWYDIYYDIEPSSKVNGFIADVGEVWLINEDGIYYKLVYRHIRHRVLIRLRNIIKQKTIELSNTKFYWTRQLELPESVIGIVSSASTKMFSKTS